jgi:hypothetical protein
MELLVSLKPLSIFWIHKCKSFFCLLRDIKLLIYFTAGFSFISSLLVFWLELSTSSMLLGSKLSSHKRNESPVNQLLHPQLLLTLLPRPVLQRVMMKAGFHPSISNDQKPNVFDLEHPRARPSRIYVKELRLQRERG